MKGINTSIFDFPTLRDPARNYVYVDKTAQLYELAKLGADCIYYLPRPRRFGKSLMISTLKALFQGRRELFRGLAIEQTDWDWEKEVYPVLHLEMSQVAAPNAVQLEQKLQKLMELTRAQFGVPFDRDVPASANFMVFARAEVVGEEQHSLGRPDAVLRADRSIYVFEFKYAQSADAALAQCREKRYADAYAADGRRVVYIGVNYDPTTRTIDDVKTECVQE